MPSSTRLLSLNLAHFFDHYILLIFPTVALALGRDWAGGYAGALGVGTWTFAVFAVATVPAGWLGDRWSRPLMMRVFWLGAGGACIATGLAPSPGLLAAGLAAIGLFAAIYHPVATAMVYAASEHPGRALAVNGVFGNLGIAAAALVTAALTDAFGWGAAFIVPGAVMLILGAVLSIDGAGHPASAKSAPASLPFGSQTRIVIVLAATALLGGLIFNGITIILPKLIEERFVGWTGSLGLIGGGASAILAVAAFAQLPVGRLLDELGPRRLILVIEAVKTPLLVLLALGHGPLSAALALPIMLLVFGEIPVTAWLLGRWVAPAWRSRAYGVQFLLSLGVGAATVPLITFLHGRSGDSGTLVLFLAGASAVVWMTAMLLPRTQTASTPVAAFIR